MSALYEKFVVTMFSITFIEFLSQQIVFVCSFGQYFWSIVLLETDHVRIIHNYMKSIPCF